MTARPARPDQHPAAPRLSALRMGLGTRLGIALGGCLLLWAAIAWSIA